ncbi:MAG: surface lipoprotein assembly modifier [Pseudoxanthomonas sp.]
MGNYSWFDKKYQRPALAFYNGDLHALSLTAVYFRSPRTVLYGGLSYQRDLLESADESSTRLGGSLGLIKLWSNGLNLRGNARYSRRHFDDYSLWDRTRRRSDDEYQFDMSLSHDKLQLRGLSPRLGYQYIRIDSSIPSLYARTGNQWTLTLEKNF